MAHSPPPKLWYLQNHRDALQAHMHFPVYGEGAYVLEGRHGGLVGTRALGEENGP